MNNKSRVTFLCPDDMVAAIDSYATSMSINRTSAILVLLNQAISSNRAVNDFSDFVRLAQKLGSDSKVVE